ncbi:MAG: response regulator transcription factor [Cryomorphaceae bacterium]|nr:response regulator transcription factor [Cryomorphaceae bacterium]
MKHRILIVEDDTRISDILSRGLNENGYAVTPADSAEMAREFATDESIDLVVTDIMLPGEDGISFCQWLRKTRPSLPIIMLTALGTTDDKVEGFDAGADDYLVKPFEMRELLARIKRLLKRYKADKKSTHILSFADVELNSQTKSVTRQGKEITLTPREYQLLEFMLRNKDRVISREEIARNVWNLTFDTGTNFIDVYINYLRKKIDKPFSSSIIQTKPGMGFMLELRVKGL